MDKDYIMRIAQTARQQLLGMTPVAVIWSWGIHKFEATVFNDMPTLRFHVNGRLFEGHVIVALNDSDYYEVYLQNTLGTRCVNDEVCFNELGEVIDTAIESGTDKEEYDKFCHQQMSKLFSNS